MRRACDLLVATFILIVLSPLYAVIAIAVAVRFGANPLFKQQRLGLGGTFECLKFRTLPTNTDPDLPRSQSSQLPSAGHLSDFLRHRHLDELPQIFNILKGDMTFVGPRPMIPSIVATLEATPSAIRHSVHPGIAGLWQVSEDGAKQIEPHCELDVEYVARRSLRLDLAILYHSARNALGRPKLSRQDALSLATKLGKEPHRRAAPQ